MLVFVDVLYLPITKSWIVSLAARRTYFVCALAAFSLIGVLMASRSALQASGATSFAASQATLLVLKILLWPGIVGGALLCIAMWYFWFTFDDSGWLKKALWALPLYLLVPIGPAFYYFLVYRRNPIVSNPGSNS